MHSIVSKVLLVKTFKLEKNISVLEISAMIWLVIASIFRHQIRRAFLAQLILTENSKLALNVNIHFSEETTEVKLEKMGLKIVSTISPLMTTK